MAKTVKKIIRLLILLALLAYTLLYWRTLRGVDSLLTMYPLRYQVEYGWLLPMFDGRVQLNDVYVLNRQNDIVIRARSVVLDTGDIRDWFVAKEKLTLKEFPEHTRIHINQATTTNAFKLAAMFPYLPQLQPQFLFPDACQELSWEPGVVSFDAEVSLNYRLISSELDWLVKVDSFELAKVEVELAMDGYNPSSGEEGYIDRAGFAMRDPLWLQQLSHRCRQLTGLDSEKYPKALYQHLNSLGQEKQVNAEFARQLAVFLNAPLSLEIMIDPPQGLSFEQLTAADLAALPELTGLAMNINGQPIKHFVTNGAQNTEASEPLKEDILQSSGSLQPELPSFTEPSLDVLAEFIDAKVLLQTKSGQQFEGYLRETQAEKLILEVRRFKGQSRLPFAYQEVAQIDIIRLAR